ncbi:MAG: helix-turn-helix transcriptional regulator [Candidatus Omnitrophota bacterium]
MTGAAEIYWDKNFNKEEAQRVLKNESDPRFIEFAAFLLSRTNQPKVVFKDYLGKTAFCNNWRRIKLRMRKDKWGDSRIMFWDEVYRVVRQTIDKKELKTALERNLSVDPDIKKLCEQIREARKAKGLTQGDLARKAGLSQQSISFMEQGYVNISLRTLKKITDALGLKISLHQSG